MEVRGRVLDGATERITDLWWLQLRVSIPYFILVGIIPLVASPVWLIFPMAVFGATAYAHVIIVRRVKEGTWMYGSLDVQVNDSRICIEDAATNKTRIPLKEAEQLRRGLVDVIGAPEADVDGNNWRLWTNQHGVINLTGMRSDVLYIRQQDIDELADELDRAVSENADALLAEALTD